MPARDEIAAMREYLRQWIERGDWRGREIHHLRLEIDGLNSRREIAAWLSIAEDLGIDPL